MNQKCKSFLKMLSSGSLLVFLIIFSGCNKEEITQVVPDTDLSKAGPVIHHVSVGSADACAAFGLPNGCDKNFSLSANMFADGTVKGQWQDGFAGGGERIHVVIDCMVIVGNGAVIGGVIKKGKAFGVDVTGQRAITAVVDNGTSANDPADQISFSFFPGPDCAGFTPADFPLFNLTTGQVIVN